MAEHLTDNLLRRFHSQQLAESEAAGVRAHLQQCPTCSRRSDELRQEAAEQTRELPAGSRSRPSGSTSAPDADTVSRASGTAVAAGAADITPTLPGYEILHEIHRGGQGIVYEAFQKATKRKVALKVMLAGRFASKSAHKRFEREIELQAQLKHPNIVAIFDSGTTVEGAPYYVMDHIRGLRIDTFAREKKLSLRQMLELFAGVCDTVQYAHQKGVIHRDLKPSNILVDTEGNPKVLDFGLAKAMTSDSAAVVSLTEEIVGTLPYMSPEQARGTHDEIDIRTDVYALGVVLYELLTGKYPYPVIGKMMEVLRHIVETPPTPPSHLWDQLSGVLTGSRSKRRSAQCPIDNEIETIVLKALTKERERRYQSAADLARDIRHYLAGEPLEAKRDSGWYLVRKMTWRNRRRILVGVSGIAIVLSLALFVRATQRERMGQALSYNAQAVRAESFGRPEEAAEQFRQAAALEPTLSLPLGNLCRLQTVRYCRAPVGKGDAALLKESLQFCDRAINVSPDAAGPRSHKGLALLLLNDAPAAERVCREGIATDGRSWAIRANLAKSLALQQRMPEALQAATDAIRVAEKEGAKAVPYAADAWLTLGSLQLALGDAGAAATVDQALASDRTYAWSHEFAARQRMEGDSPEAIADALRHAVIADSISPVADPRIKRTLAQAQLKANDPISALRSAEAAIQLDGQDAFAAAIAVVAAFRAGDMERARKHLASAGTLTTALPANAMFIPTVYHGILSITTVPDLNRMLETARVSIQNQG